MGCTKGEMAITPTGRYIDRFKILIIGENTLKHDLQNRGFFQGPSQAGPAPSQRPCFARTIGDFHMAKRSLERCTVGLALLGLFHGGVSLPPVHNQWENMGMLELQVTHLSSEVGCTIR